MKLTQQDIIIRFLQDHDEWIEGWRLRGLNTRYGFLGSSADVRVRELARNDCPERLRGIVEREEGKKLGLDPRYEYFRARPISSPKRANYAHEPWCALQISINNGGPIFNKCDCKPKPKTAGYDVGKLAKVRNQAEGLGVQLALLVKSYGF